MLIGGICLDLLELLGNLYEFIRDNILIKWIRYEMIL